MTAASLAEAFADPTDVSRASAYFSQESEIPIGPPKVPPIPQSPTTSNHTVIMFCNWKPIESTVAFHRSPQCLHTPIARAAAQKKKGQEV
jgi:hypothetical protein